MAFEELFFHRKEILISFFGVKVTQLNSKPILFKIKILMYQHKISGIAQNNLIKMNNGYIAFGLIFLGYLIYLSNLNYDFLPFDSKGYWHGDLFFIRKGEFSLTNFANKGRGYLLPLVFLPFNLLWKASGIELFAFIKVLGAFSAALLFGIAAPKLWEVLSQRNSISLWQRLLFAFLGFIFWRDYFSFSLSDFPAIIIFIFFLIIIYNKPKPGYLLIAGILYGATVNIRPSYLICIPVILLVIWFQNDDRRVIGYLLKSCLFLFGGLLINVPQTLINLKHHNSISPLVFPKKGMQEKNLYLKQLEWGLEVQKYETNIGPNYPGPQLVFLDPLGSSVNKKESLKINWEYDPESLTVDFNNSVAPENGIQNFGHYFEIVLKNPIEFIGIYSKHVFNGLDIQFPTPYIKNVFEVNYLLIILNYSVIFFAILSFWLNIVPQLNWNLNLALALFIAPAILAIPTAIECRFFLPIHLFCYALLAFPSQRRWLISLNGKKKFYLLGGYVFFIIGCFLISAQIQQTLMLKPRILF